MATECGASLILVNERDRATGELVNGQAVGIAALLPPDVTCLACGGISRLDQVRARARLPRAPLPIPCASSRHASSRQVRTLRRAGYDGFVLGRSLLGDPRDAEALMAAIAAEQPVQRWSEVISVPKPRSSGGNTITTTGGFVGRAPGDDEFGI